MGPENDDVADAQLREANALLESIFELSADNIETLNDPRLLALEQATDRLRELRRACVDRDID